MAMRGRIVVAALCLLGGRAGAEDVVKALGGPKKIIGRGALVVMDVGEESHHALHVVDPARQRDLEIEDYDYFGTRRARVAPFLGAPDLVDVTVLIDDKSDGKDYHNERHLIVRTTGKDLEQVCEVIGTNNIMVPQEPAVTVRFRRAAGKGFAFDVDSRSTGQPPKRARYTIARGASCEGPVEIAAIESGDEARVVAALRARGYRDAHVLQQVAPGAFVGVGTRGQGDARKDELALVTPAARPAVVALGEIGLVNARDGVKVTSYEPFLERKDVRDLQIETTWSNGMGGSNVATHYLVRTAGAPSLACTIAGDHTRGMEDVTSSTSATIRKLADDPLTFEITRRESSRRAMGGGAPGRGIETCTLPPRGACACQGGGPADPLR